MRSPDDEPTPRTPGRGGRDLDRQLGLARRQLDTLVGATAVIGAGTSIEEALAALSLTLDELEVTAEELGAQQDELVATRRLLDRERRRFQSLFDLAPEAYVVTDLDGIVRHANRQTERLLDRDVRELVGKPLAAFVHPDDRAQARALLSGIEEGPVRGLDVRIMPSHRPAHPVSLTVRRGRDPDHEPELRWVLNDAAAHQLARAELADLLDEARAEADQQRDVATWQSTLLGASAHDLRTPLGVVSGTVETLLEHGDALDDDQARELLESAQAQTAKLRRVLAGLLNLSRLQLQADRTRRGDVDVRAMVDRVLASLPRDGRTPEVEVDVEWGLRAAVDPAQLERIIENLAVNAHRHAPDGSTIRIAAGPAPDEPSTLLLTVEDRGPGIPDDVKELVFEPFVHLDQDEASSGLGLAIVAMFTAYHGGRAWVEDRDGGGASFRVLLADALPQAATGGDAAAT